MTVIYSVNMKERPNHLVLAGALILVAVVSIFMDLSGLLKSQVLSPPQIISQAKLIPQEQSNGMLAFDIYYQQLSSVQPPDLKITLIKGLQTDGGKLISSTQMITGAVLATGTEEIINTQNQQLITIRGIRSLSTTKLGTLLTTLPANQYLSLEYDVTINGVSSTLIDNPLPSDLLTDATGAPVNYFLFQNPTQELLYVSTPSTHALMSPFQIILTTTPQIPFGALLLANQTSTLQPHQALGTATLISEPISKATPTLRVEQGHLVLPRIPQRDLNALTIRYRTGSQPWKYSSFSLLAGQDLTLPVPTDAMLDFFTEIEYSFSLLSDALPTLNPEYPLNSLLDNGEYPVFYRTAYESLMPELVKNKNALSLDLKVSVSGHTDSLFIGVLSRAPLKTLKSAVELLSTTQNIVIFDETSKSLRTRVSDPHSLPWFNLVGKVDQVWSQEVNGQHLDFLNQNFSPLPLAASNLQAELEIIYPLSGDRLLCLLHTEEGDFSLGVLSGDLALSSDCLKSARRAGFERGKLFPVVYRAATEKLEASRSYEFSPSMSRQTPIVTQFDPVSGIITLNEGLSSTSKGIQILSSPSHQFSSFNRAVANQITTSTYGIPSLSGCPGTCFLKVLILLENSDSLVLATASDTIIYSESPDPLLDLCFVNSPLFKNLFQAEDLHFQIRKNSGEIIDLNYQPNSGCYERVLPTESGSGAAPGWSDFVSTSAFLPTETMVISTNGYRNSVITIPPQKHFARLKPSALHLLSSSALTFEHSHLVVQDDLSFRSEPKKEGTLPTPLQTSYQISSLDSKTTLVPVTRGNVVLKKMGENNALEQSIPAPAPINETLLFPGFGNTLSTPNTIRIIPPEELLTRPLQVNLELPRNSQVKILFKPLVRSDITSQQSIQEGIRFDEQTLFFTAENLSGQISIPLKIELPLPTDTSRYALTFPPTPLPADIGIATLKTQLMLNTEHPSSLPQSTLLDPLLLRSAAPGSSYTEVIDFGALETYQGFEVLESGFPSTQCAAFFTFNKAKRELTGSVPGDSTLQSCFLQLAYRYLMKEDFGDVEVSAVSSFVIPLRDRPEIQVQLIPVPIPKNTDSVSQNIYSQHPLENVFETSSDFIPKSSQAGLIEGIGALSISYDFPQQAFVMTGSGTGLTKTTSRFIRAIDRGTGNIVLFELQFLPVEDQEIIIPLAQDFPNRIDVPRILSEQGFSELELSTLTISLDTLPGEHEPDIDNIVTLFATVDLQDQSFSALLERDAVSPTGFEQFDTRTEVRTSSLETRVRVRFHLQLYEAETITLDPIILSAGKNIILDVKTYAPASQNIVIPQIPDFLTQRGSQLSGTTPLESQEITLLIQDYTNVRNLLLPIQIGEATVPEEVPDTEPPVIPDKPAATEFNCFPDIGDQPFEYQEAICLAKEFNIISGSNGLFLPNNSINRAEVSKILVSGPIVILEIVTEAEISRLNQAFSSQTFPDTKMADWFFGFVETVSRLGIFDGYPDKSFRPANALILAEAAKVIVNTLLELKPEAFTDQETVPANTYTGDQWFAPYVRILNNSGGDFPIPSEVDELSRPVSRAQFIYNLMILLDSKALQIRTSL